MKGGLKVNMSREIRGLGLNPGGRNRGVCGRLRRMYHDRDYYWNPASI